MYADIGLLDVIAMIALFVTGFLMWVAWELILPRKAVALFLALGTFSLAWLVASAVGAGSPWALLAIEILVLLLLFRVGNRKGPHQAGR